MRLHRFYIEEELRTGNQLEVHGATHIHQWLSVFRYKTGDRIILFNGSGSDFEAAFLELHKKQAVLSILSDKTSFIPSKSESSNTVHLYLAAIKKDLFELAVEKCTELGITSITPIITERTQDKNLNMDRLKRVAIEASEQSGRGDVPEVKTAVSLQNALDEAKGYTVYVAETPLDTVAAKLPAEAAPQKGDNPRAIFIGPEGGWGEKDKEILKKFKVIHISLGETVLRAETAAIVGSFTLRN